MNYNLAKKLKDAGFPQEPKVYGGGDDVFILTGSFYWFVRPEACVIMGFVTAEEYQQYLQSASDPITPANNPPELFKLPTLSELVDSCGPLILYQFGSQSVAVSAGNYESKGADNKSKIGEGLTLEEAVANLWLALHETLNDIHK